MSELQVQVPLPPLPLGADGTPKTHTLPLVSVICDM